MVRGLLFVGLVGLCSSAGVGAQEASSEVNGIFKFTPFDRGWYISTGTSLLTISANYPCPGPGCAADGRETINVQDKLDFPNFELTVGYRLFRFLSLEGGGTLFGQPESNNPPVHTFNNGQTHAKDVTAVRASVRADYPLPYSLSLFASYGVGYMTARFTTAEIPDPIRFPNLNTMHPTYDVTLRKAATFRPAVAGLEWYANDYVGFRVDYMPPTDAGGFAVSLINFGFNLHW